MAFYERFRAEERRYREGVHELGEPASAAERARATARLGPLLGEVVLDLYASWNGMRLFLDAVVILPLAELGRDGDKLRLGEAPEGLLLADAAGRIFARDEDGEELLVGSSPERYLAAVMAREGLLVDREGEFNDVFDDEEPEGLRPGVRSRRARAALKADAGAAAWHLEAAELALEGDDAGAAEAALERAVSLDERAAEAWQLLGGLRRQSGRSADAAFAFAHAAAATVDAAERAERYAAAARAAVEAGDEAGRARHAACARASDGEAAGRWVAEAEALLSAADADGAAERAGLAAAIEPDGAAARVLAQARVRQKLRPLA